MRVLRTRCQATTGKLLGVGAATVLTALAFASTAPASSHHPTGEFAPFAECPLSRPTLSDCVVAEITGGTFTLGTKTLPIKNPVKLQGGFEGVGAGIKFFGAENGETLSKSPQPLPPGTFGTAPVRWPKAVQSWFSESLRKGPEITATVELAAPATAIRLNTENFILEEGVALQLPLKIKLSSPLLGSSCYLGSGQSPIVLQLSTGTSGKLRGSAGKASFNEAFTLSTLGGARLVSSAFVTSAANGCGGTFSAFIDPLLNSAFGTTPAGNAAVFNVTLLDGSAEAVRRSE